MTDKMAIRYAIASMIFLAKCSIYMLRVHMSIAILTMVRRKSSLARTDKECLQNITTTQYLDSYNGRNSPIYNWSELSMCGILAAYYAGYYITELFGSYFATFSPKNVISWFLLLPSIVNALIPVFLTLHGWTIFVMRMLIGICSGINQESFAILTMRWAPPGDRVLFAGSLYGKYGEHWQRILQGKRMWSGGSLPHNRIELGTTGGILGTICGWIGTAYLGEDIGWDIPFYAMGTVGIVLTPFWCLWVSDSPAKNRFISSQEQIYLEESIPEETYPVLRNVVSVPWWTILKNKPVWVLCIFTYGDLWNLYFWLILGPKYLVEVSGFTVKEASLYILVPYITRLFTNGLATCIWKMYVRYDRHLSLGSFTIVRRIFTIFSHMIPGILTLCLGLLDLHCRKWYAYITITAIMMFNGASSESSTANAQDLSTVYGSNIISFITMLGMSSAVLSTLILGGLLQFNYAISSWRIMFFVNATMYLGPGLLFILFGKGRLQYFHQGMNHIPDISSIHFGENIQPRTETSSINV